MLEARAVTVIVNSRRILENANLTLLPGQLTVVMGPNGAGKSTLFKALSGELTPTSGGVYLDGQSLLKTSPALLSARRAVVPQASHLSFPFTVLEVVLLGATIPGLTTASKIQNAMAQDAIVGVGLEGFSERLYVSLSGGERQRVHLARALCQLNAGASIRQKPALLLLDEPTSSLDLKHQIKILKHVAAKAQDGYAVLVVLHDLNLAAAFAD
ncbi:MAG: ATP-binding cassette domain-containing protein, partial [Pseudomonadota bacterium]